MTIHLIWQLPLTASLLFVVLAVVYFRVIQPRLGVGFIGKALYIPAILIWLYDISYNVTIGALMFWQWPISKSVTDNRWRLTFSDRLQHIVGNHNFDGTWRRALALPIARFVNWSEPKHIRGV